MGYSSTVRRLVIKASSTIRKKVYNFLREQLLSGEIQPHQHLIEAKVARDIGTSRTPVREAFHSLELEGLIESRPRAGYVVKPISEKEVEEICEIRATIEGLGARWAMGKAHGKLVVELKKNIAASEERILKGDVRSFVDMDAKFHEIISKLSGSQRLVELAQTLRRHMLRYRVQSIYSVDNVLRAIEGHKGILGAIEKRDVDQVNKAIGYHLEQSKKDILRYAFQEIPKQKLEK